MTSELADSSVRARRSSPNVDITTEHRASPRAFVETEVDLHTESTFFTGLSEDVSRGGLFVATYGMLPIGTDIELSFSLPSGHRIRAHGRVVWLREVRDEGLSPGMGIAFQQLDDEDEAAVRSFLLERPPAFYDI